MPERCTFKSECLSRDNGGGCRHNKACYWQDNRRNTKMMRTGPCQDRMWYSVQNDEFKQVSVLKESR